MFVIPVEIRKNCDSVWLFARMTDKMMFSMIMNQVGLNGRDWWEEYLEFRDVVIVDFSSNGTKSFQKLIFILTERDYIKNNANCDSNPNTDRSNTRNIFRNNNRIMDRNRYRH
jgi:hypothetical protein